MTFGQCKCLACQGKGHSRQLEAVRLSEPEVADRAFNNYFILDRKDLENVHLATLVGYSEFQTTFYCQLLRQMTRPI